MFKKFGGPNDLTRLEGTRRKTKLSLMDDDDGVGRKVSWRRQIHTCQITAFCALKNERIWINLIKIQLATKSIIRLCLYKNKMKTIKPYSRL